MEQEYSAERLAEMEPEDVQYHKFQTVVEEQNEPKLDWVKNGVMSVPEFNRLKEAEDIAEYRQTWIDIHRERKEERRKEKLRRESQERYRKDHR